MNRFLNVFVLSCCMIASACSGNSNNNSSKSGCNSESESCSSCNHHNSEQQMESRKILVTIDLQKDFINGNLSAKDAEKIIPAINGIKGRFDLLYFTLDWHPANHCSFKQNGGIWPTHCVHFTEGAAIPDVILSDVEDSKIKIFTKGSEADKEEYGAFTKMKADCPSGAFAKGDEVVVCGIASEYCVLETLKEIVRLSKAIGFNISVYMDGVACIENHDPLLKYMEEQGIPQYK